MSTQPYEKHVQYNGIRTQIRIPEDPVGLVFIAPGAAVQPQSNLITTSQKAAEDMGYTTVVADLSEVKISNNVLYYAHEDFVSAMKGVIDGYLSEHDDGPEDYGIIAHSMGGAAAIEIASGNPNVSKLTLFDPTPVHPNVLESIDCPAHIVVSNVRSFKNSGSKAFAALKDNNAENSFHAIDTSKERQSGHMFEGQETQVRHVIHEALGMNGLSHDETHDLDAPENT